MTVFAVDLTRYAENARLEPVIPIPDNGLFQTTTGRAEAAAHRAPAWLDLSRSRTHDAALDILKCHKLSGNFHVNLETVLKDMGIHDKVSFQVERNPRLIGHPDCCHVTFSRNDDVPNDVFEDIVRSITARIGSDAPWWDRLFGRFRRRPS